MFPLQRLPWDEYFAAMAQSDFKLGRHQIPATKSFFIRSAPFGGSFALLGGITEALRTINELRFDADFRAIMEEFGYEADFLDWLQSEERLKVQVYAPPEGSVFFPSEPVVTFRGPLAHIRLVEGMMIEALNFSTLSLTKWQRLVRVVRPGSVLEFARRRSQHHLRSSLYGLLAGCRQISNSEAARLIGVKPVGTMGHEWMQSFGDVREAFDAWLKVNPHKPVGLVDTLQCLEIDFPAWLEAVYEQREVVKAADSPIWGWRNDSGDLAYLTIEQYIRFWKHLLSQDQWFADRMHIVLTNDLDEYSSEEIIQQIRSQAGAAGLDAEDLLLDLVGPRFVLDDRLRVGGFQEGGVHAEQLGRQRDLLPGRHPHRTRYVERYEKGQHRDKTGKDAGLHAHEERQAREDDAPGQAGVPVVHVDEMDLVPGMMLGAIHSPFPFRAP